MLLKKNTKNHKYNTIFNILIVPDVARVKSYHTLELNGFVYIWYHAEGIEPTWTPPEIEEITRREWGYRGRTEHIVNAHIEVRFFLFSKTNLQYTARF